jgi:hypothetical protein
LKNSLSIYGTKLCREHEKDNVEELANDLIKGREKSEN